MKKLYISQVVNGKTEEEVAQEQEMAIKGAAEILGEEIEVIDTVFDDLTIAAKPIEYLARSMNYLSRADVIYFSDGWEKERKNLIEGLCAYKYNIPIIASTAAADAGRTIGIWD